MRNFRILFAKLAEHVMIACFLVKSLLSEIHESKDSSSFGIFPSRKFNETVSMDLKEIKGIKILHLVDNFTRFSVASKVNSKESLEIISVIFKIWIAYFGPPLNFLTDNGGEFNNESFREMAQNLKVIVRTTAAQSPWSNGLCERHNSILNDMVIKTMEDTGCNLELALSWAVCSKNALHNVNGFSPNQLVFGYNPNVPTVLVNKLPALEGVSTSEVVASNLNAMHSARKSYIQGESSEKIMRALRHKVRSSVAQEYNNGDLVYFKRNESNRWLGPGSVIGSENKQVLVMHGGTYVRVHPCRLQMYNSEIVEDLALGNNSNGDSAIIDQSVPLTQSNYLPVASPSMFDHQSTEFEGEEEHECEGIIPNQEIEPVQVTKKVETSLQSRKVGRPSKKRSVTNPVVSVPKIGQKIYCKIDSEGEPAWSKMKVLSRAGKVTGKNKYILNVCPENNNPFWLDFENSVLEWKDVPQKEDHSEIVAEDVLSSGEDHDEVDEEEISLFSSVNPTEYLEAMKRELQSWVDNNVYSVVSDSGQNRITTRWICTTKESKEGEIIKARLVARGFQDEESEFIRSDSPTCSKESLRVMLGVISSLGWKLNSMDIKTAFLQGKQFERTVYVHSTSF